ncbi:MAG: response regulator [Bacteroidetes bacterium]|nr:response regulator [Bacteroidota bacterium]
MNPLYVPFRILLVDDDPDDCMFFKDVLNELSISSEFTTIDGEGLMRYLSKNKSHLLPDVIFLDLNMPSKNGFECLENIKSKKKLQHIPVIIYSTSYHEVVADELYENGAHFYIQKSNLAKLEIELKLVLTMMQEKKMQRPPRNKFVLSFIK